MKKHLIYQGIPVAAFLMPFFWVGIGADDDLLKTEFGIIENLTVLFLFTAIGFCIWAFRSAGRFDAPRTLKPWIVILMLGASYFALEEISYGQHIFGWSAGETWSQINNQQETNLHNIGGLFDQLPRSLLTLGILIGGIIMPLVRYFRRTSLPESNWLYWQWPTMDCLTAGLIVIFLRPVLDPLDLDFINIGETKELFFAIFILLYCASLAVRLKSRSGTADAAYE